MQLSIIEAWAHLPCNCYFTDKLTYGSRQERAELSDVFERSTNLLSAHGPYDESLWLRAAINAHRRFQEAFFKKSWIVRASKISPLYTRYEAFLNQMASEAALAYKGQIHRFKCLCAAEYSRDPWASYHYFTGDFIFRIFKVVQMNILSAQKYKGFFYELKRDQQVVCYMIGIVHFALSWMLEDQRISQILERSQELFVETAFGTFLSTAFSYGIRFISSGSIDGMDVRIMSLARSKKISDLDPGDLKEKIKECLKEDPTPLREENLPAEIKEWQMVESASEKFLIRACGPSSYSNMQGVSMGLKHMRFLEIAEGFISGNEKLIEFYVKASELLYPSDSTFNRNALWLEKKLLPRLKETNAPFCIAVGAAHLFGEKGLLHAFEQNGIEIHRLNSTQDIT